MYTGEHNTIQEEERRCYGVGRYRHSHETGHYSQLVWARTSRVGCGLTEYKLGAWVAK